MVTWRCNTASGLQPQAEFEGEKLQQRPSPGFVCVISLSYIFFRSARPFPKEPYFPSALNSFHPSPSSVLPRFQLVTMAEMLKEPYTTTTIFLPEPTPDASWPGSDSSTRRNSITSINSNHRGAERYIPESRDAESALPLERQKPNHDPGNASKELSSIDPYSPDRPKLSLRERLKHLTWAWYTLPMSTGGLALLMDAQPKRFHGLNEIGLGVYILNLFLFSFVTVSMVLRFVLYPGLFLQSLKHPREGLFFPTFFLASATVITGAERYVVPENNLSAAAAIQGIYWVYVILTLALALGHYSFIFAGHSFNLQTMMPSLFLPIFPTMLSGTIASVIAGSQPESEVLPIVISGLTCQGLGIFVSCFMYAHMIGRLLQSGLPSREHRPGLFMCVGPPAFTALALIGMANALPENFNPDGDTSWLDSGMIQTMSVMAGVFLWALSFWWLGIAVIAVAQAPPKHFHLGHWAAVFPNLGFTLATISIAREFGHDAVLWFTAGMSIIMVVTYLVVLVYHVWAVIAQDIMYPGRDEDVVE